MDIHSGDAGGLGEGRKVDIGAEIGAAGRCQRIGWAVARYRAQAASDVARRATVIDEQRGPRGAAQPRAEGRSQVQGGGTNLEHRTRRGGSHAETVVQESDNRWIFRTVDKDQADLPSRG